jgi:hypothetical protein
MSLKTINVTIGNNLNAIVKDRTNVNAVATFLPEDALTYKTPQIAGGHGYGPFKLEYNTDHLTLNIDVYANNLGSSETIVTIPLNASELSIDLQGTYNGKIDIETNFN